MSNDLFCTSCNKEFKNKYTFKNHMEKSKKCIKERGLEITSKYICESCNHVSMQKSDLQVHLKICTKYIIDLQKTEYDLMIIKLNKTFDEKTQQMILDQNRLHQIIAEQQSTIAKLEAKLEKFENVVIAAASEPKTSVKTTNNVVVNNNTLNLSQEHVTKVLDEHFTKEVAAGGQKGLAKMVREKMLTGPDGKPTYVCVDSSRQTFEFTNNDGDVERDVKAKKLTKALINSKIQQKAAEVGNQIWTKADGHVDSTLYEYCSPKVMELACFEKDDSKFRSELSALTS